mmetsp:Transcript_1284/g.1662  ORF Transcript_1284/g.1662 Transcript_1284/m.1662 type:complete len:110 (-) Transcript_1284:195-524(-)
MDQFTAFFMTYTFYTFQAVFQSLPFLLYFLSSLFALVFAVRAIPDTDGVDLHDLERRMAEMPWWKEKDKRNRQEEFANAMTFRTDNTGPPARPSLREQGISTRSMRMLD